MRSVRICVLSSGSAGNCLWVEAGATRALIDAGLPLRTTARRCRDLHPTIRLAARVSDRGESIERALGISVASVIWLDEFDGPFIDPRGGELQVG